MLSIELKEKCPKSITEGQIKWYKASCF